MIVANYPYWPRMLRQIGPLLGILVVLSIFSVILERTSTVLKFLTIPEVIVTVLGATLTILLGFRTNSAYGRWWEARTLWGALVNQSRSLARQAISFTSEASNSEFAKTLVYRQIAFVHAMRCSLRRQSPWDEIAPFLDVGSLVKLRSAQNVPNAILLEIGLQVAAGADMEILSQWQMHRLDQTMSELSNVLGACERIKNTPLPRQYDYYPELLIKAYCFVLPFIIVEDVKLLTPFVTLVVGAVFLVLNRIGKNLEDPFENQPYDVPLSSLSRTIEINLRQMLGEADVPAPLAPANGVLM